MGRENFVRCDAAHDIAAFFVDHFLFFFSVVCSSVDFCHSRDGKYEAI